jgi:cytochrome c553
MARNPSSTVTCVAAAILVVAAISLTISNPAHATAQFASQSGKPCAQCHEKPDGGPELTAFGKAFQANGNKVPTQPSK